VDAAGCSQDQFCAAVETSSIPGLLGCLGSDFGNDEPGAPYLSDCRLQFSNPSFTCAAS